MTNDELKIDNINKASNISRGRNFLYVCIVLKYKKSK